MPRLKSTRAAKAQSSESIIAIAQTARALAPALEKLLTGIDAVLGHAENVPAPEAHSCHPQDRTDARLRAYVASVESMSGTAEEDRERGAVLIERLAASAQGSDSPALQLTPEECADVLAWMADRQPVDPDSWWQDPKDAPSHLCGFYMLLQALEHSLAAAEEPDEAANAAQSPGDVPAIPVSLFENDLHDRLMNAAGIVGTVRKSLDEDCAEAGAALAVAVSMLHKIDDELDTASWGATEAWALAHPDHPDAIERRRILEGMRTPEDVRS